MYSQAKPLAGDPLRLLGRERPALRRRVRAAAAVRARLRSPLPQARVPALQPPHGGAMLLRPRTAPGGLPPRRERPSPPPPPRTQRGRRRRRRRPRRRRRGGGRRVASAASGGEPRRSAAARRAALPAGAAALHRPGALQGEGRCRRGGAASRPTARPSGSCSEARAWPRCCAALSSCRCPARSPRRRRGRSRRRRRRRRHRACRTGGRVQLRCCVRRPAAVRPPRLHGDVPPPRCRCGATGGRCGGGGSAKEVVRRRLPAVALAAAALSVRCSRC